MIIEQNKNIVGRQERQYEFSKNGEIITANLSSDQKQVIQYTNNSR